MRGGATLRVRARGDQGVELLAPSVGVFTPRVGVGDYVTSGQCVGTFAVLGVGRGMVVPPGVAGRVTERAGCGRTHVSVQYGDALISVASVVGSERQAALTSSPSPTTSSAAFLAPMSGRYYSRPSPGDPPFVDVGDTVTRGQTIGLLEVMKTFNRLVYQGDAYPAQATVEQVVPGDGADVVRGDPILLLGPLGGD